MAVIAFVTAVVAPHLAALALRLTQQSTSREGQLPPPCSAVSWIQVVDGQGLTAGDFEARFQKKLVLLTGLTDGWPAAERWSRAELAEEKGKYEVQIRDSYSVATGRGTNVASYAKMRLDDYLDNLENQTDPVFDNEASQTTIFMKEVKRDYTVPVPVSSFQNWAVFSMGPAKSGIPTHRHQENWFAQVRGRKAWLLSDAKAQLPCVGVDRHADDGALRCVQEPGTLLWLPTQWPHATCNIDHYNVGVGGQGDVAGHSPLHLAAKNGDLGAISALLAGGQGFPAVPVNSKAHPDNRTALGIASDRSHVDAVEALLAASADPRITDRFGRNPLMDSAAGGCAGCIERLLAARADASATTADSGRTALHWAALKGHPAAIAPLLAARIDPAVKDDKGNTPLLGAAYYGHMEAAGFLLSSRADLAQRDGKGWGPVHSAVANNRADTAAWFVGKGSPVDAPDGSGRTPLQLSCLLGHSTTLSALIEVGADINKEDDKGITAVQLAAMKKNEEGLALLLAARADITSPGTRGISPLRLMVASDQVDLLTQVLASGATSPDQLRAIAEDLHKRPLAEAAIAGLKKKL